MRWHLSPRYGYDILISGYGQNIVKLLAISQTHQFELFLTG